MRTAPEVNGGAYCFKASWLWESLSRIEKARAGEFYLTSLVSMAASQNARIEAPCLGRPTGSAWNQQPDRPCPGGGYHAAANPGALDA